jgi:hypothetical protein
MIRAPGCAGGFYFVQQSATSGARFHFNAEVTPPPSSHTAERIKATGARGDAIAFHSGFTPLKNFFRDPSTTEFVPVFVRSVNLFRAAA